VGTHKRSAYISATSFKRKLLRAEGQQYKASRNIECQFKVPLQNWGSTIGAEAEPTAQYVWPRTPDADEAAIDSYRHPFDQWDQFDLLTNVFGATWWNTVFDTSLYSTSFLMSYIARYQIMNGTNIPVRFQALTFKVKKNVPWSSTANGTLNLSNPMNIAGEYLYRSRDTVNTDQGGAKNKALHTERVQIERIPTWNHWFRLVRKKHFSLDPGASHSVVVKRRQRNLRMIDVMPNATSFTAVPAPAFCFMEGDVFVMFKMLSDIADVNDATTDPLTALSTRTTPLCLLSYQVNYFIARPAVMPKTSYQALQSSGFKEDVTEATIGVMADDDIKETSEKTVL